MKRKTYRCLLILISIFAFSSITFGEELEKFQYTSHVEVHNNQEDFILLEISPQVYGSMDPELKDLRLYHKEKPLDYMVFPKDNQQSNNVEGELDIFNKGIIGSMYSFEIMCPKDIVGNIEYSVKLNPAPYLVNAKIYGSNDRKGWKYLKTQTIYGIDGEYNRFQLENIQYDMIKIEYPLMDNGEILEVTSMVYTQREPVIRTGNLKTVDFTSREDNEKKTVEINMDHQYNHYPTKGIVLKSEEKYFYRQVTVSGSNDKENWDEITKTFVFRDGINEKLEIDYSPREYRYLRMVMYNEDNHPLEIKEIETVTPFIYVLVNVVNEPKDLTLKAYWGNPSIAAPKYDIANLNIPRNPKLYKKYTINSYLENEEFEGIAKQLPLTERYLWLMPGSLALLTVGALIFLYKTVKQVK